MQKDSHSKDADFLDVSVIDGVAWLTLTRPEKRNALSPGLMDHLSETADALAADEAISALVLAGEGDIFCAGGDLNWMRENLAMERAGRMREARRLAMMLKRLNELPKPLLACVEGDAYGGGVGLLCTCDEVIAVPQAHFAFSEVRLGLIASTICPYVMARIGEAYGRQVMLSGRRFDAARAQQYGIVSDIAEAKDIRTATQARGEAYQALSLQAVAACKRQIRSLGLPITEAVIEDSVKNLADMWETEEAQKRIKAFLKI